jgi:hypothetical protein
LDDSTGQILVFGKPSGNFVRVLGDLVPSSSGLSLQAQIIQDISAVDRTLFTTVKKIFHSASKAL